MWNLSGTDRESGTQCVTGIRNPQSCYRLLALRGHVTNASFKHWLGILLVPKIDGAHKNYLTPEIWEETHLREIFSGTLIFQQSSMICIGRHVRGHTLDSFSENGASLKNQINIILFKIWPANRFSKAISYNFYFHKSDVTCPLSAKGLLCGFYLV